MDNMKGDSMKFRRLSEEMPESEIEHILMLIFPYAKLRKYERNVKHNYITVFYSFPNDTDKEIVYKIDLLPDDIYEIGNINNVMDGEPIKDGEILWKYMQHNIAKGYSEYWLGNPYVSV